jgi:hypothetical protein
MCLGGSKSKQEETRRLNGPLKITIFIAQLQHDAMIYNLKKLSTEGEGR